MPRSRIAGLYDNSSFFVETSLPSSTMAAPIYIPTNSVWGFPFLHTLQQAVFLIIQASRTSSAAVALEHRLNPWDLPRSHHQPALPLGWAQGRFLFMTVLQWAQPGGAEVLPSWHTGSGTWRVWFFCWWLRGWSAELTDLLSSSQVPWGRHSPFPSLAVPRCDTSGKQGEMKYSPSVLAPSHTLQHAWRQSGWAGTSAQLGRTRAQSILTTSWNWIRWQVATKWWQREAENRGQGRGRGAGGNTRGSQSFQKGWQIASTTCLDFFLFLVCFLFVFFWLFLSGSSLWGLRAVWYSHGCLIFWYSELFLLVKSISHVWLFATHGLQHVRLPCPSLSPGVCSDSSPLSWWCYLTISSSATLFSFCLQSFPESWSFPVSWLVPSDGRSNFSISPSNEYSELISFRIDWFDLLAVWETLKSLL